MAFLHKGSFKARFTVFETVGFACVEVLCMYFRFGLKMLILDLVIIPGGGKVDCGRGGGLISRLRIEWEDGTRSKRVDIVGGMRVEREVMWGWG